MDTTEDKDKERESWKQGIRAVFAGFVASAHPRGVSKSVITVQWGLMEVTCEYRYVLVNRTKRYHPAISEKSRYDITNTV